MTMVATQPAVNGIANWTFPDGTEGDGVPEARVMWVQVWRDQ